MHGKRTAAKLPVEPFIHVHAGASPVGLGVPFMQGLVASVDDLSLLAPDGAAVACDRRAFVSWPDGSARWVLFSFIPKTTGVHRVVFQKQATPKHTNPVSLTKTENGRTLTIDNGLTRVVVSLDGAGPVRSIRSLGQEWIAKPEDFRLVVNDADSLNAHPDAPRQARVLEEGATRTEVQVMGDHRKPDGARVLDYRLNITLWADSPAVRFDYQFFHKEPGIKFLPVTRISADIKLNLKETTRHFHQDHFGEFYEPREVYNPAPVGIITDDERFDTKVENAAMLLDDYKYDSYLGAPLVSSANWIGVLGQGRSAYGCLHEMTQLRPKRIASAESGLSFEAWPAFAGTLDLPQGRSRRITFTLGFFDQEKPSRGEVEKACNHPLHEGRGTVDPEWLAYADVFEQAHVLPFGKSARFEKFINRATQVNLTSGFFDLGDTTDSGYQRSYPAVSRQWAPLRPGVPQIPRAFGASGGVAHWLPITDYEPVWVNNEYDGIHAIASELMRTGQRGHWNTLRWMARHNIEVDFWHYHDNFWLNQISPVHSARHSSNGGYPSHFWTQGLMEYYCLTADPDALEISILLGDAIIRFFHDPVRGKFYNNFDRENGWALLALVHVYDITREPRFKKEIDRLINFFMHGEQSNTFNTVGFKEKKGISFNRDIIQRFYFMLNLIEAADLYQKVTQRQDIHQWLVEIIRKMPESIESNFRQGGSAYSTNPALAIGFERTGDLTFLTTGLIRVDELIQDDPRWLNPIPEVKPMAILYREFARYLGHAYREGLLDKYEYPSLA